MRSFVSKAVVLAVAAGVTGTFFINFCDLVYQCGCESLWAGVAAHCNIHAAQPPHCPWCASQAAGNSSFGVILGMQALAAFLPGSAGLGKRLALALAAFPVAGGVMALAWGWCTGYWA